MSPPRPPLDPALFELPQNLLWVLHCAMGPCPRPAREALEALAGKEARVDRISFTEDVRGLPARARRLAARLVGGREEDVSLSPTTTTGLATVAQGLDWSKGDVVLAPLGEFPTNHWPWRTLGRHGVEVEEVPLWDGHRAGEEALESNPPPAGADPEARLLEALERPRDGRRVRVLAVSWVRFQDGLRLDLERLAGACRQAGVELVVDGIQGAGTLALELDALPGVSAFASGGHKGLLGVHGQGFLWTREELRRCLAPPGGWLSLEGAEDFSRPSTDFDRPFLADGPALETGVPNLLGTAALAASLEVLLAAGETTGPAAIEAHVEALQKRLLEALARSPRAGEAERLGGLLEAGRLGSILSFHHAGFGGAGRGSSPDASARALLAKVAGGRERGIHSSVREGYLRIALHGWHRPEDTERLAAWLGEDV